MQLRAYEMMALGHAATGAAGIALLGLIPGFIVSNTLLGVFILLGAGFALLPDLDHPKATAATTWGFLSKFIAVWLERLSALVYFSTRRGKDAVRQGGHRTLTHTAAFAIFSGVMTFIAGQTTPGLIVCLFVGFCLGLRGLLGRKVSAYGKLNLYALSATLCALIYMGYIPIPDTLILAVIVAVGTFIHSLGDCLTNSGAPLFWPLPIRGQLWYRVKAPVRFNTGSKEGKLVETAIKIFCLLLIVTIFAWRLYAQFYLGWSWYV